MTLVLETPRHGRLQQVQIGPVDVVATLAAANSAWGWVGGFTGISHILKHGRRFSIGKDGKNPFSKPTLNPATCQILTYGGVATFRDEDIEIAFGGDPSSQMLGLTICALEYELKDSCCVELFMTYLAPGLLRREVGSIDGLREILFTGLRDNLAAILNEGAARGLTGRFYGAIAALGFTRAQENRSRYKGWGHSNGAWPSEWYMIGGFLKWIGSGANGTYPTRSAAVARLAACLKEVGYKIGTIESWDGLNVKPASTQGVLVVIGGSSETDPLIDQGPYQIHDFVFSSHYYFATTGAMLLNSLQTPCDIPPEVFQQYFEDIHTEIRRKVHLQWVIRESGNHDQESSPIHAVLHWTPSERRCSRVAVRLASFYFQLSAEIVAPFYERIAEEAVLSIVKKMSNCDSCKECIPDEIIRFRIITASIYLSVIGFAAGEGYDTVQHTSRMHLRKPRMYIAERVDEFITRGLRHGELARLIAAIHCGQPPGAKPEVSQEDNILGSMLPWSDIIGCRKGSYAVLPEILFSLASELSASMLGFRCVDDFIGNVPVQKDGWIKSSHRYTVGVKDQRLYKSLLAQSDGEAQIVQVTNSAFLGHPSLRLPDVPLYLHIERPVVFDEPMLGLCGRVKGEAIGNVGIPLILQTLIASLVGDTNGEVKADTCTKHGASSSTDSIPSMLNIPPSVWALTEEVKPSGDPDVHTYIPVKLNSAWALFIAGETECRITFGCAGCATESTRTSYLLQRGEKMIVIGYR